MLMAKLDKKGKNIADEMVSELTSYTNKFPPFDRALKDGQTALSWWIEKHKISEAKHLSELAIQIFSALPTSMPDERTASTLAEINSPKRNRQKASTIVYSAQIRQWYRYHSGIERYDPPAPVRINFHAIDHDLFNNRSSARDIKNLINTFTDSELEEVEFVGESAGGSINVSERDSTTESSRFYHRLAEMDRAESADVSEWLTINIPDFATQTGDISSELSDPSKAIEELIDLGSPELEDLLPDLKDTTSPLRC